MALALKADVEAVTEILRESGLRTLVDGLAHAVPCQGQARHWMQEKFAEMVRAALQDLQRAGAARREQFQPAVTAASEAIQEGERAQEAAAEAEKAALAASEESMRALEQCRAALAKTKLERADAEAARDVVLQGWRELEAKKNEVTFLLEGPLRMLLEGGWEDEEVRDQAVDAVAKALADVKAEAALVAAAPVALAVRPESRQEFDKMTADSAVEILEECASSLDAQLQAASPALEDADAEALGLMALAEREIAAEQAASEARRLAQLKVKQAAKAREEAAAELAGKNEALSTMLSGHVLEEDKAKRIAAALDAAERLVAFEYSAAQPDAVAPAEGAAMAVDATEAAQPGADMPAEDAAMATEAAGDVKVTGAEPEPTGQPPKVEERFPTHGNLLRVPTPMKA